jgi:hypothetical protein
MKKFPEVIALMPVHGRHSTMSLVLPYYRDMGIRVLAVCSGTDLEFLRQYDNVLPIWTTNHFPNKLNVGLKSIEDVEDWKYLLMVGCDDWISESLLEEMISETEKGFDTIGISNCIFYDRVLEASFIWPGYPLTHHRYGEPAGAWRLHIREVIERIGDQMFDCAERAMDLHSWQLAKKHGSVKVINSLHGVNAIDIKDEDSMTSIYSFGYLMNTDKEIEEKITYIVNKHAVIADKAPEGEAAAGEGGLNL